MAGLPLAVEPIYRSAQIQQAYAAEAASNEAFDLAAAPEGSSSGELETLYIFELEGRKDLAQDKEIGFLLFQENVPLVRVYTWNAYLQEEGPAVEEIRAITSSGRNHTVKETTETWTYHLKVESNLDRVATLEATDTLPQEAEMIDVTSKPAETTATSLKWRLQLLARQKTAIDYSYRVVTTESLDGSS